MTKTRAQELERLTFLASTRSFRSGHSTARRWERGRTGASCATYSACRGSSRSGTKAIFVIQNKVAPAGLRRKTWRQGKSVQNQIMEGIGQLEGAINALRRGEAIYRDQAGTPIESDPPECVGKIPSAEPQGASR